MTEKEQLLPCPFCGGEDKTTGIWYGKYFVRHECDDESELIIYGSTKQEAINKWNTRAISTDEKEQLRRLKAFVNEFIFEARYKGFIPTYATKELINKYGLVEDDGKKADWLKDENDQKQR